MSDSDRIEKFVRWFHNNSARLLRKRASEIAEEFGDEIMRIDGRLGVEAADDDGGAREVIITGFSDPNVFTIVREIVQRLGDDPNWRFIPLKPPRGFGFTLTLGRHRLAANALEIEPIAGIDRGFRLLFPAEVLEVLPHGQEAEELAWLIVETGVGEALAAQVQHLEFGAIENSRGAPISRLADHIGIAR